MQRVFIILLGLNLFLFVACNGDDDSGCPNEDVLCETALELVDRGTFIGGISYCNAQQGMINAVAVAQVFLGDTGATILLKSDPENFIDTFYHVKFDCLASNLECLSGSVVFTDHNDLVLFTFKNGASPGMFTPTIPYKDCSFIFEGSLQN